MQKSSAHTLAVLAALAATLVACNDETTTPADPAVTPALSVSETGNGAPSGAHYNLNIVGAPKQKNVNMDGAAGNVIFVALGNKDAGVTTKILLEQSAVAGVFEVLDKNGTDGEAKFSLPTPGGYTVWARALGQPGDSARITTCATDVTNDPQPGDICSTLNEVFVRGTKQSTFRNVTPALTTIELDPVADAGAVTACNNSTTVSLFDPCLEGYFWKYDNYGLKLLQIRFYLNPA